MHDTVIRGGTIVDGTGKAAYAGDVALDCGVISQVGGKAGPGKREIDANGLLVTPGWSMSTPTTTARRRGTPNWRRRRGMA